jgi:hypothetical protein
MCKIDWNLIMQIFSAIGSMLVVIIAIWGDWIRTKLVPPKLRIIASNTKGELTTFSPTGVRVIYYHFKALVYCKKLQGPFKSSFKRVA